MPTTAPNHADSRLRAQNIVWLACRQPRPSSRWRRRFHLCRLWSDLAAAQQKRLQQAAAPAAARWRSCISSIHTPPRPLRRGPPAALRMAPAGRACRHAGQLLQALPPPGHAPDGRRHSCAHLMRAALRRCIAPTLCPRSAPVWVCASALRLHIAWLQPAPVRRLARWRLAVARSVFCPPAPAGGLPQRVASMVRVRC